MERRGEAAEPESGRAVPVTLLAGFLGSGKTTVLNRLLSGPLGRGAAVIVNEFGELPIDGALVRSSDEEVIELANGCVCCTVRGDLVRTARELFERRNRGRGALRFDRIVLEASGLASPGPVHQTFRLDDVLCDLTRPGGIVTLAHAALVERQIQDYREASEQIGFADVLVLNHIDQVDGAGAERAEAALRAINVLAPIHRGVRGDVDLREVLACAERGTQQFKLFAEPGAAAHTDRVASYALRHAGPVDLHRLKIWLQFVAARRDWEVMRIKGILRASGRSEPVVVQAVHQFLEIGPGDGPAPDESVLVVIGRDIDERVLRDGFARTIA